MVRDNNGSYYFLTVIEAGGRVVIDAIVGLPPINLDRTIDIERVSKYTIKGVAVSIWDIYSNRLPKIIYIFCYIEGQTHFRAFMPLSALKRVLDLVVERMVVESLIAVSYTHLTLPTSDLV